MRVRLFVFQVMFCGVRTTAHLWWGSTCTLGTRWDTPPTCHSPWKRYASSPSLLTSRQTHIPPWSGAISLWRTKPRHKHSLCKWSWTLSNHPTMLLHPEASFRSRKNVILHWFYVPANIHPPVYFSQLWLKINSRLIVEIPKSNQLFFVQKPALSTISHQDLFLRCWVFEMREDVTSFGRDKNPAFTCFRPTLYVGKLDSHLYASTSLVHHGFSLVVSSNM